MQPMIGLPSGLERVRWNEFGHLAATRQYAEDVGAARLGGLVAFEHERGGAFGHDEAVAVLGERLGRGLRRIIRGRERREQREPDQRLRIDRAVGADAERGVGLAAADRLDAELDRARARRAGGRYRDRRALGAETVGEVLGDRTEQATLVNGVESARGAGAQQIVIADRVVGAGRRRERLAMRPFDLDRRDREKEWTGKVALAPDAGLGDRLLGDHLRPCARRARSSRTARPERNRRCRRSWS